MSSFSVNEESELCSMINNFRRLGKSTKTCVTVKFPLTQKHYSKIRQEITETKHYDKQVVSKQIKPPTYYLHQRLPLEHKLYILKNKIILKKFYKDSLVLNDKASA